jgi:hypothetical protein
MGNVMEDYRTEGEGNTSHHPDITELDGEEEEEEEEVDAEVEEEPDVKIPLKF